MVWRHSHAAVAIDRTLDLAQQIRANHELTSLEVDDRHVGVVLGVPYGDWAYFDFDARGTLRRREHFFLGPRGAAVGARGLSHGQYTGSSRKLVGESNDGGRTFHPFWAYDLYLEAECNRAGCLIEDAYRRGWELPRRAPVTREESNLRPDPDRPLLRCKTIGEFSEPIRVSEVLDSRKRGSALAAGVTVLDDGRVMLHLLDRRGVHGTHELLAPARDPWQKNDNDEIVHILQNGVVYRYRSLSSHRSEISESSEIEWAYLELSSQRVWRRRRAVPVPVTELNSAEIEPWRDWAVLTTFDRQIVIPGDPQQKPYFTQDGKPVARSSQCAGPASPNVEAGPRLVLTNRGWKVEYADDSASWTNVTFRPSADGLCAESLDLEFTVSDQHLFVPLADLEHSIEFQTQQGLSWRSVRCESVAGWPG